MDNLIIKNNKLLTLLEPYVANDSHLKTNID